MKLCLAVLAAATIAGTGCSRSSFPPSHENYAQASAANLMIHYGCPTCHIIPNVPGASGKVGPPLKDLAQRSYLAGTLQNSPANLVHWIEHPQQVHPGTAMPEMNIAPADAERIAAFLENRSE